MRSFIITYSLLFLGYYSFAQTSYNLEIDQNVQDSVLHLDLYIKSTGTKDFNLGGSNFIIDLKSSGLDTKAARFLPGEFDISSHPAYESMGMGYGKFLVMNVRANVTYNGDAKKVETKRAKLASVEVPITDPCQTVNPVWIKDGAIQLFSKGSLATDITAKAVYVNPQPIDLDGGLSKIIPSVNFEKGILTSSSKTNNQWYLDNVAIPGANKSDYIPKVEGNYAVEVTSPCAKNISAIVPVFITGLQEFTASYNFKTQPNPFIGESKINYSLLTGGNISLKVYDISGTHLLDLENSNKAPGNYEFSFVPGSYNLQAGTYIIKLSVNDKIGSLKLVSLK